MSSISFLANCPILFLLNSNWQHSKLSIVSLHFWHYREFEDGASLDGSIENIERGSIASFGSGNTTDSDNLRASEKVSANRVSLRQ